METSPGWGSNILTLAFLPKASSIKRINSFKEVVWDSPQIFDLRMGYSMSCINFLPNLVILTLSETKEKNLLRLSRFVSDPPFGSNSPQETYLNMIKFFESIHIYLFMSHPQTGR